MEEDNKPKRFSIEDFKSKPRIVEAEGHRFEVRPVTLGLMTLLSKPAEQDTPKREIAIRALQASVLCDGEPATLEQIGSLPEHSIQRLSQALLEVSSYQVDGGCPIEALGTRLKDHRPLFSEGSIWQESVTGKLADSLRGITAAGSAIDAITARIRPDTLSLFTNIGRPGLGESSLTSVIQDHPLSGLADIDFSNTHEARSARAAEDTAEAMQDMLVAQGEMLKHIGELTDSLVRVALPQWLQQVKDAEAEAKSSADRAQKGLWWAIAAVVVSVMSTVGTAVFDAYRSASDGIQVDIRADAVESLLHRQVEQNSQQWEVLQQIRAEQFDQLSDIRAELARSVEAASRQPASTPQGPSNRSVGPMPPGAD